MPGTDNDQEAEDKVGYKHPPKKNRFKPGQSGNPRGRPKSRTNFKTDFEAAIFHKVDVTVDGRKVRLNKQQLLVHQLINKALGGDLKAAALVLKFLPEIASSEPDRSPALSSNLKKIAENFLDRQRRNAASGMPGGGLEQAADTENNSGLSEPGTGNPES